MFLHERRGAQLLLPADCWWSPGEGGDRAVGKGGSETEKQVASCLQIRGWNVTPDVGRAPVQVPKQISSPLGKRQFSKGSHIAPSGLERAP